jgi:NAD dependent epimerase/dehydratase family enzyme
MLQDEVDVIVRAIDDDRLRGPVNAVAPRPVTNTEFTRALGRAVGRPTLFAVPRVTLELALGRELADELLFASQRVVPEKLRSIDHPFAASEIGEAMDAVITGR